MTLLRSRKMGRVILHDTSSLPSPPFVKGEGRIAAALGGSRCYGHLGGAHPINSRLCREVIYHLAIIFRLSSPCRIGRLPTVVVISRSPPFFFDEWLMQDRRSQLRKRTFKAGTLAFNHAAGISCTVRNISGSGACLVSDPDPRLPRSPPPGQSGRRRMTRTGALPWHA